MNAGTGNQDPGSLFGSDVMDSNGDKVGTVDNVWVDDSTNELEFVGVKTGWLFGKTHIIPCTDAQVSDGQISVPYSQDQIKDAPTFGANDELSPDDEQQVYSYYGLDRSTSASPTGLASGETGTGFGSDGSNTSGYQTTSDYSSNEGTNFSNRDIFSARDTGTDGDTMRLHEEELEVGKRQVDAGQVRLRKVVSTERQEVPVELQREEVEIERVPVSQSDSSAIDDTSFQEHEINVPVQREEAVVGKNARATEEVRLNKNVQTETQTVGGDVRREDVQVDREGGTQFSGLDRGTRYGTDDPEGSTNS